MKGSSVRLALLISGGGTTAAAVIDATREGLLPKIVPVVVIASTSEAAGIVKASERGLETAVVSPKQFLDREQFGVALLDVLKKYRVDVVSQNGWLPLMPANVIQAYEGRIINQHPGPLDPGRLDFGGLGMYGKRVTCARIAYSWMTGSDFWTEATVHHVTEEFDKGNIVAKVEVPIPVQKSAIGYRKVVQEKDALIKMTKKVAGRLLGVEHMTVIQSLAAYGRNGEFPSQRRSKQLIEKKHAHTLGFAKRIARELFPNG